jgi:Zn-dependent metalloprotease
MKKRYLLAVLILAIVVISGCQGDPLFSKKVDIREIFSAGDGLKSDIEESNHIYKTKSISENNNLAKLKGSNSEEKVLNYVKSNYGINIKDLYLEKSISKLDDKEFIYFIQKYKGIPVYNSRSVFFVKNSKLSFMKMNYYKIDNLDVDVKIYEDDSIEKVKNDLRFRDSVFYPERELDRKIVNTENYISYFDYGLFPEGYYDITGEFRKYDYSKISVEEIKSLTPESTELIVYPKNNKYYLTYKIDLPLIEELPAKFTYFVDANTGRIIDVIDNLFFYDVSGTVTGLEWEDPFTDGIQLEKPFINNYIEINNQQIRTDKNGDYFLEGLEGQSELSSYLRGPWVSVYNAQAQSSQHNYLFNENSNHEWNWNSEDNSYLNGESNVFYHVNRIHDYAVSVGATEMNFNMAANVDIQDYCNAFYQSRSVNFFQFGNGCENTAVISDIILHEYGHGIVDELNPSLLDALYWDQPGNIHEAIADYWACTINENPSQGEGFYVGDSEGLRICDSDDRYPEDYNPEPHSGCQILSGALWDVRDILGKEYLDPLIVEALRLQPIYYTEFLEALIIVDDDNADLSDGTPNIVDICSSFVDNHGILSSYCAGYTSLPIIHFDDSNSGPVTENVYIIGTIAAPLGKTINYYSLEYLNNFGEYISEGITLPNNGESEVINGIIASIDRSGILTFNKLILTIHFEDGTSVSEVYSGSFYDSEWNEGWPVTLDDDNIPFTSNAASDDMLISDLNNDGLKEVIVSHIGYIYVIDSSGSFIQGWPKLLPNGASPVSLAISDLNNDGLNELIVKGRYYDWNSPFFGQQIMQVYNYDGSVFSGWPKNIGFASSKENGYFTVADLNNDGNKDIILSSGGGVCSTCLSNGELYVLDNDGEIVEGWPYILDEGYFFRSPTVLANLDDDTDWEIVITVFNNNDPFANLHSTYAFNYDGSIVENFPVSLNNHWGWMLAAGDLNNDGVDEIMTQAGAINSQGTYSQLYFEHNYLQPFSAFALGNIDEDNFLEVLYGAADCNTYLIDYLGNILTVFYAPENGCGDNAALIMDVYGDDLNEIIIPWMSYFSSKPGIHIYNSDGSHIDGYPKYQDSAEVNPILIDDFDGDGYLELIGFMSEFSVIISYDLDKEVNSANEEWPMSQHDIQRSGNYDFGKCGNSVVDTPNSLGVIEECDDGNDINTDACTNECKLAVAHDGICWEGHERCGECFVNGEPVPCDDCVGYSGAAANCYDNKVCMGFNPTNLNPEIRCVVSCSSDFPAGCFYRECPQEYNEITGYEADMSDPLATACSTLDPNQQHHEETWLCCALP